MARMLQQTKVHTPKPRRMELSQFKGVDLSSTVTSVKPYRSPDALNMMPDLDGFPVKRTGYYVERQLQAPIFGGHTIEKDGIRTELIHAGDGLYINNAEKTLLYQGMAENESVSFQIEGKLVIADGKRLLIAESNIGTNGQITITVAPADENPTIPMVTIARSPRGMGAESYHPVNLLTPWVTDSFLQEKVNDVLVKNFVLSFNALGAEEVRIEVLNSVGVWEPYTDVFTVDKTKGIVKFTTAPAMSPVTGEDNVRITYAKSTCGKDKINHCKIGILYGLNGTLDRLRLAGNPAYPAFDWYCERNDPTFFGDIWYAIVGQPNAKIMGYATMGNMLVTVKQNEENNRNIFIRTSVFDSETNETDFPFVTVLEGDSAIGAVVGFNNEPLYLTRNGLYAIASTDVTGERYVQNRGYYLQGGLTKEKNLEQAKPICFGQFFGLSVNGKLYLLDKNQKNYEPNQPHSTYQYEGYLWNNIPATALWEREGTLCFGTAEGEVMVFYKQGVPGGYNDNVRPVTAPDVAQESTPIHAYWTTPLMQLSGWSRYKTIQDVWVVGQPYQRSGGDIYYATDREYARFVKDYTVDMFDFNDIDFNRFTFNTLDRPAIVPIRKKAKKVKLFQVKVENKNPDEAFGMIAIMVEYKEGGKIKK